MSLTVEAAMLETSKPILTLLHVACAQKFGYICTLLKLSLNKIMLTMNKESMLLF